MRTGLLVVLGLIALGATDAIKMKRNSIDVDQEEPEESEEAAKDSVALTTPLLKRGINMIFKSEKQSDGELEFVETSAQSGAVKLGLGSTTVERPLGQTILPSGSKLAAEAAGLDPEFQKTPQNLREALGLAKVGGAKAGSKLDSVWESSGASALSSWWNGEQPKKDRHFQPAEDAIAARLGKKTTDEKEQLLEVRESAMSKQETEVTGEDKNHRAMQRLRALSGEALLDKADYMAFGGKTNEGLQQSNNPFMPRCYEEFTMEELKNAKWCDPKYAPHGKPPPKKLQGLYWMKWDDSNLWSMDVAVCMSTSEWDPETKTLKMQVAKQFIYKDSVIGNSAVVLANQQNSGAHYECKFDDDLGDETLSSCHFDIIAKGGLAKALNPVLNTTVQTFREIPADAVGAKNFARDTAFAAKDSAVTVKDRIMNAVTNPFNAVFAKPFENTNNEISFEEQQKADAATQKEQAAVKKFVTAVESGINGKAEKAQFKKKHRLMKKGLNTVFSEEDAGEVDLGAVLQNFVTGLEEGEPMYLREVSHDSPTVKLNVPWLHGKKMAPGEVLNRVTIMRNVTSKDDVLGEKSHHYPWIKIMDGDMKLRQENYDQMVKFFKERELSKAVRYTDDCKESFAKQVLTGKKDIMGRPGIMTEKYDPFETLASINVDTLRQGKKRTIQNMKESGVVDIATKAAEEAAAAAEKKKE